MPGMVERVIVLVGHHGTGREGHKSPWYGSLCWWVTMVQVERVISHHGMVERVIVLVSHHGPWYR